MTDAAPMVYECLARQMGPGADHSETRVSETAHATASGSARAFVADTGIEGHVPIPGVEVAEWFGVAF